jgi:ABC-type cobalamin transport system permease subunit
MARLNGLRFLSLLLVVISLSAGLAHLFALPNKIAMSREEYLVAQQIYRGWALLGIATVGALLSTLLLAMLLRRQRQPCYLPLGAALCVVASLLVFFVFTYPANQATLNWTQLPAHWQALRRQWEFSHATGAGLYLIAFVLLTRSLLAKRD